MSADPSIGVAIVGCGLIGNKRAGALGPARLIACVDVELDRALVLATARGVEGHSDWRQLLDQKEVDVVIVATTNDSLAEITKACIEAGKHVLVEKPAGRSVREVKSLIEAARQSDGLVRVGFNHRHHRAVRKARALIEGGALGELMYVRGRYGHGGRPGYEREWRADPALAGGGELLDQGVHLIDLARWFLGDFSEVMGFAHTYFWQMPVEDNGFMLLKTAAEKVAFLHVSWTEWKNLFSLEIYGRDGKLQIDGLGGSYGVEQLVHYKMLPQMGPPESTIWQYPTEDDSWEFEFAEFLKDIRMGRKPSPSLEDAQAALEVVERIYAESAHDHSP